MRQPYHVNFTSDMSTAYGISNTRHQIQSTYAMEYTTPHDKF